MRYRSGTILLANGDPKPEPLEPDEKPETYVTSAAEAMHAATIRAACIALNDAVRDAAKDGLLVTYVAQPDMAFFSVPNRFADDSVQPPLKLVPTILRRL